jgi:3-phenylpropionate/cinnamic acid dioxygenase small subunit
VTLEDKEAIRDLLQAAAWLRDSERSWSQWLALFAEEATYEVTAHSSEIKASMQWFCVDGRDALKSWMEEVPTHVRDVAQRLHIVSPITIDAQGDQAQSLSYFSLFRTMLDGETHLYAVGHYEDHLVKRNGQWRFLKRTVKLHTRVLETGSHVPF